MSKEKSESVDYLVSSYQFLTLIEYKGRHNKIGHYIHWKMHKYNGIPRCEKWYKHQPKTNNRSWNHHGRLLSITVDAFELSIEEQTVSIQADTQQNDFVNDKVWPHVAKWVKTSLEMLKWEVLPPICHIHQTLPCPIITCSSQWHMA